MASVARRERAIRALSGPVPWPLPAELSRQVVERAVWKEPIEALECVCKHTVLARRGVLVTAILL